MVILDSAEKLQKTNLQCGSCHGQWSEDGTTLISLAPVGHRIFANLTCWTCHLQVVDQNDNIIDPSKHINGQIEFGD